MKDLKLAFRKLVIKWKGFLIKKRDGRMIYDKMYKTCKDCPYYKGEINLCMYGEEDVPNNLEKKCEVKNES